PDPQRSRRQPYRSHRSRAAELDGADDRAVAVDASGAARAIKTIECEKLARHEAPRRVGAERFRARQTGCEQGRNHHREPRNHTNPPPPLPSLRQPYPPVNHTNQARLCRILVNKSSMRLPDVNHDATANAALDDVAARLDHLGKPDLARHGRKLSPIEVARQPLSRHSP